MIALAIIGWLLIIAAAVLWIHGATRKPTPHLPIPDYEMRYHGGDEPCRVCGVPTAYADRRGPIHPDCRNLPVRRSGTAAEFLSAVYDQERVAK